MKTFLEVKIYRNTSQGLELVTTTLLRLTSITSFEHIEGNMFFFTVSAQNPIRVYDANREAGEIYYTFIGELSARAMQTLDKIIID